MQLNEVKLTAVQLLGLSDIIKETPGIYAMSSDSFPDVHPDVLTHWRGETWPRGKDAKGHPVNPSNRPTQEPRHDNYGREFPTVGECRQAMRAVASNPLGGVR